MTLWGPLSQLAAARLAARSSPLDRSPSLDRSSPTTTAAISPQANYEARDGVGSGGGCGNKEHTKSPAAAGMKRHRLGARRHGGGESEGEGEPLRSRFVSLADLMAEEARQRHAAAAFRAGSITVMSQVGLLYWLLIVEAYKCVAG